MSDEKAYVQAESAVYREQVALLTDTRAEVLRLLGMAAAEVQTILAGAPGEYLAYYLPKLQAEIERAMVAWSRQTGGVVHGALGQAWGLGQATIDRPLQESGLLVAGQLPRLDTKLLDSMSAFHTERIKNIASVAVNAINGELGLVTIGAKSVGDAITSVQSHLGGASKTRATTIVRTSLSSSASKAANMRAQQAAEAGVEMEKVWRRSGKIHPRLSHALTDGQRRKLKEPFVLGMMEVPEEYSGGVHMMHPHDPTAPASEVIMCGCRCLYRPSGWKSSKPDHKPFTDAELDSNPKLRAIVEAK